MNRENRIGRRAACAGMLALGGGLVLPGTAAAQATRTKPRPRTLKTWDNATFYKPDGSFDAPRAMQAYLDLMKHYGYPVNDAIRGNAADGSTVKLGAPEVTLGVHRAAVGIAARPGSRQEGSAVGGVAHMILLSGCQCLDDIVVLIDDIVRKNIKGNFGPNVKPGTCERRCCDLNRCRISFGEPLVPDSLLV